MEGEVIFGYFFTFIFVKEKNSQTFMVDKAFEEVRPFVFWESDDQKKGK